MKKVNPVLLAVVFIHFISPVRSQNWLILGNSGTDPKINFIGTKDDRPLLFRIRNVFSGIIDSTYRQTFFGYGAGKNQSGTDNTAFGFKTLNVNNNGTYNTAIGSLALTSNTTGYYNSATGYRALWSNTTGANNAAFGMYALAANLNGYGNTAMGAYSLQNNNSGGYNTATGWEALYYNNTGYYNTALGTTCMIGNFTGSSNTASGFESLYNNNNGSWNTSTGNLALKFNYSGSYNTAVGGYALTYSDNAYYNTALGYAAGGSYYSGWNNVFLGANTRTNGTGYYNVIAIGQDVTCTAVSQARIGNSATSSIGGYVGWSNISDGRFKKEIKEDVKGLDFIMMLRPVTYHLDVSGLSKVLGEGKGREADPSSRQAISDKEKIVYTGFIAQEVEAAAQKLNFDFSGVDKPKNEKDLYGLRYAEFVVPLVKSVQELQGQVNELKKQVESLIEMNKELQQQLKKDITLNR